MWRADEAVSAADAIVKKYETRNPDRLVRELGITVIPLNFKQQKGAYKVIERNRFIFIKKDLHPVMRGIVLLHEIGHDTLHRKESVAAGGFQEFNIFDMQERRMEYEANVFASQIALPDEDVLELIYQGYDVGQIARSLRSDINLVAIKVSQLISRGYQFRGVEFNIKFLK